MYGHGCNKCSYVLRGKKRLKTTDQFTEEASELHKNSFDYSKFVYVSKSTKGIVICKICNYEFYTCPNAHLHRQARLSQV